MTDKIESALTAEEWKAVSADEDAIEMIHWACRKISEVGDPPIPNTASALIALANDALPDSDPRKITRAWLTDIREGANGVRSACQEYCVGGTCECGDAAQRLDRMADALESYLPHDHAPSGSNAYAPTPDPDTMLLTAAAAVRAAYWEYHKQGRTGECDRLDAVLAQLPE